MKLARSIRTNRPLAATVGVLLLALIAAPAVSRMECLMSGQASYSVGEAFECCDDEQADERPIIRALCCDLSKASPVKTEYLQQVAAEQLLPAAHTVLSIEFGDAAITTGAIAWLATRPPPLSRPERHAVLGSLLI